jgi:hypothetical protein
MSSWQEQAVNELIRLYLLQRNLGAISTGNINLGANYVQTTSYRLQDDGAQTMGLTNTATDQPTQFDLFSTSTAGAGANMAGYANTGQSIYFFISIEPTSAKLDFVTAGAGDVPLQLKVDNGTNNTIWKFHPGASGANTGQLEIPGGSNIQLATATGTKIGTGTNQLLGFYNATPVDQPATVADPAGGGTQDAEARTAIVAIIDRLQELGLIA